MAIKLLEEPLFTKTEYLHPSHSDQSSSNLLTLGPAVSFGSLVLDMFVWKSLLGGTEPLVRTRVKRARGENPRPLVEPVGE